MNHPPRIIETQRLLVRPVTLDDAVEMYEKWGCNDHVSHYMVWKNASSVAETAGFLQYAVDAWQSGEEYTWLVTRKGSPALIGSCAMRVRADDADFGYLLLPEFWGHGYIVEAMKPILKWCWAQENIQKIWATCHIDNPQSARVVEKLGLKKEALFAKNAIFPQISSQEKQDEYLYSMKKYAKTTL